MTSTGSWPETGSDARISPDSSSIIHLHNLHFANHIANLNLVYFYLLLCLHLTLTVLLSPALTQSKDKSATCVLCSTSRNHCAVLLLFRLIRTAALNCKSRNTFERTSYASHEAAWICPASRSSSHRTRLRCQHRRACAFTTEIPNSEEAASC